jgi:hypothetical protein
LATDVTAQTTRHADDHNKTAALLAVLTPGPWINVNPVGGNLPAFATGWYNFGGGWQLARIRREGGDICRIEGFVAGVPGSILTVPIGYRPAQNMRWVGGADTSAGSPAAAFCRLDILSTGVMQMSLWAGGGSGNVAAMSINMTYAIDPSQL